MKNSRGLSLHIPEPKARPVAAATSAASRPPSPGAVPRPDTAALPKDIRELAYGLIRVLDDKGEASGPWDPRLSPETLLAGLRAP